MNTWRLETRRELCLAATCTLLFAGLTVGCSDDPGGGGDEDAGVTTDAGSDAGGGDDDTGGGADDTGGGGDDTGGGDPDTGGGDPDVPVEEDAGAQGCTNDAQCLDELVSAGAIDENCQVARCDIDSGTCSAQLAPGKCCVDADCDDGLESTVDKCDTATALCDNKVDANFCEGQVVLLTNGFEQQVLPGYDQDQNSVNGNVGWSVSQKRGHNSLASAYLGNECETYDSSMTAEGSCVPNAAQTAKINAFLESPEKALPSDKPAHAHFWLWIDTQPLLTEPVPTRPQGIPAGNCTPACQTGQTCVDLPGVPPPANNTCLDEFDLLSLFVVDTGTGDKTPVWNSAEIGKSTNGQWEHVAINLAQFAGKAVQLRWEFKTDNKNNGYEGIYLDDVRIETICNDPNVNPSCSSQNPCSVDDNVCTGDMCTFYVNNPDQGVCFYDQQESCCLAATDCDDKNDCTIDSCKIAPDAAEGDPGVCQNTPDSSNVQCCQPSQTISDGFEGGSLAANWELGQSNSQSVGWKINTTAAKTGVNSLFFGETDFQGYDDPAVPGGAGPKQRICTKSFSVQTGTNYNVASFDLRMDTEWSGATAYENPKCFPPPIGCQPKVDHLAVQVFDVGQYKEIWSSDVIEGTTGGEFMPMLLNLDGYKGKNVKLCFEFDAGDGAKNKEGGVWIDNFLLEVTCEAKTCLSNADCAAECGSCTTPNCNSGQCICEPIAGCCVADGDCDDGDSCTADACNAGTCENTLTSPTCCSDKIAFAEGGEGAVGAGGGCTLPSGWAASPLSGTSPYGGGKLYSTNISWGGTALKSKDGTCSLYFGKDGTYNAGTDVPAGKLYSPEWMIPANGTQALTFDLFLSTEWDDSTTGPGVLPPGWVQDRLFVGVAVKDASSGKFTEEPLWDSFEIGGTTKGKWQSVVADMSSYAGKTVKVYFLFDAGNEKNNTKQGAYVDNVEIETLCQAPACLTSADCVPNDPDQCIDYTCGKDGETGAFKCFQTFNGAEGCCQNSTPVPVETAEGGTINTFTEITSSVPKVTWQVVDTKKLIGNKAIYFGNPVAKNYDDGSNKVTGTMRSKAFNLDPDPSKKVEVEFRLWIDVEQNSFEKFTLYTTDQIGACLVNPALADECKAVWSKEELNPVQYKTNQKITVDITSAKADGTIALAFVFDSGDGSKNDQFEGVYLDDITVKETCQLQP